MWISRKKYDINDMRHQSSGKFYRVLLVIGCCATILLASSISYAEPNPVYKIGVLAFRGEAEAVERWSPTAEYLNQQLPNASFVVMPFDLEQLRHAVENQLVDFVITNTGQYVELEVFYGAARITTVKNKLTGQVATSFGAVIFTRADRDDINSLEDIKGKRFMAVKHTGFGGFQMAWREMLEHGVNPFTDLASLEFSGFPQDKVAYAVRDGLVDVGTFSSDTLVQMAQEGKVQMSDFKVLQPQRHPDYNMLHSTRLYPTWPFARLNHTSRELSEEVARALLAMPPDSKAALSSGIVGWTIPLDYQPVHELMRALKVGPYAGLGEINWKTLLKQYWIWLTVIGITLMALGAVTLVLRKTNRKLQEAQRRLENHQRELVDTVHARTADLVVMRDQALAASEAKSFFLSKVSHELRTPLNAIIGYTEMIYDELREGNRRIDIQDVDKVRLSASHLLSIITDILDITRLEKGTARIVKSTFSISQMLDDVISSAKPLAIKNGNRIQVCNHLGHDQIETDKVRLQDALGHVLENACKYTSKGIITVDVGQQTDGANTMLDFRVIDNGIGISLAQQEKLFNEFVQGDDSTTRRYDGLGLGLAKSRGYCRLMGGDITLNTQAGKGSEFIISIPVKVVDHPRFQASA